MKPIHKWSIGCGLAVCLCCGGPPAWFFAPSGTYPVGANIQDLGLTPENTRNYIWNPSSRESVKSFTKRRQVRLAHFTGSIELSRPKTPFDRTYLQFIDGQVTYKNKSFQDDALTNDMRVLKSGRLSDMIAKTENDWRIVNYNNYFIEPVGPFSGSITKIIRGFWPLYLVVNLEVENGVIKKSSRSPFLSPD